MEHEKLICYQNLLKLAQAIGQECTGWARGHGYLADQIKRAIASAILNLAEGNGKDIRGKDRKRFFKISLGSMAEVAACLDLALVFHLSSKERLQSQKAQLKHCYYQIRRLP